MVDAGIVRSMSAEANPPRRVELLFVTRRTSGVGRRMESVVASLASRNRDRVAIRKVDADSDADLVARLGVRDVPVLIFVHDDRRVLTLEGKATLEELERALESCT
jgi:thioredoxin-like negative regulator of GroEL